MRKTLLAIVGVLVAPLALASQAGAWPGDDYYYAPYPPAVVVLPPPSMRRHPIMPSPIITLLPSPPTVGHAMAICPAPSYYAPPEPPPVPLRPRSCGKYRYWNGTSIAPMRDTSAPYVGQKW